MSVFHFINSTTMTMPREKASLMALASGFLEVKCKESNFENLP